MLERHCRDKMPIINLSWCLQAERSEVVHAVATLWISVLLHQRFYRGCVLLLVTLTSSSLSQGAAGSYRLLLLIIIIVRSRQLVQELEATRHVRAA